MKSIKQYALLLGLCNLLAGSLSVYGVDESTEEKITIKDRVCGIVTVTGIVGAMGAGCKAGLSPYAVLTVPYLGMQLSGNELMRSDTSDLLDKYAYAQQWYNFLAEKYPMAQFNKYKLYEDVNSESEFSALDSRIKVNSEILQKINEAYQKKVNQEQLLLEEEYLLANAEWTVLHEVGHLKHNDPVLRAYVQMGVCGGIEALYQLVKYKNIMSYACNKNILTKAGVAVVIASGMLYVHGTLSNFYCRFTERRADDFANKLADMQALKAAEQDWLERAKKYPYLFNSTHPSHKSRAQAVLDEIQRREQ